jgi:hypothetical protein
MGGGGDGYGGVRYQEWTKLAKARVLANDNSPTNSPRLIGADSQLAVFALETHSSFYSLGRCEWEFNMSKPFCLLPVMDGTL